MRVLIACECSGVVRTEFRKLGHDAWSCDIKPCTDNSPYHFQEDCFIVMARGCWDEVLQSFKPWDLLIFHPPCTFLCVSGARWWANRKQEQIDGAKFFLKGWNNKIPRICIENPIGIMSQWKKPTQIIKPEMFGHRDQKTTCLWLKNLPPLEPTNWVVPWSTTIHHMPPGPERSAKRSVTYKGVAEAMAQQWSNLPPVHIIP